MLPKRQHLCFHEFSVLVWLIAVVPGSCFLQAPSFAVGNLGPPAIASSSAFAYQPSTILLAAPTDDDTDDSSSKPRRPTDEELSQRLLNNGNQPISSQSLKKAYRLLAKEFHPDNSESGDPEIFRRVSDLHNDLQASLDSVAETSATAFHGNFTTTSKNVYAHYETYRATRHQASAAQRARTRARQPQKSTASDMERNWGKRTESSGPFEPDLFAKAAAKWKSRATTTHRGVRTRSARTATQAVQRPRPSPVSRGPTTAAYNSPSSFSGATINNRRAGSGQPNVQNNANFISTTTGVRPGSYNKNYQKRATVNANTWHTSNRQRGNTGLGSQGRPVIGVNNLNQRQRRGNARGAAFVGNGVYGSGFGAGVGSANYRQLGNTRRPMTSVEATHSSAGVVSRKPFGSPIKADAALSHDIQIGQDATATVALPPAISAIATQRTVLATVQRRGPCTQCGGTGVVTSTSFHSTSVETCPKCRGSRQLTHAVTVSVPIPPGTQPGTVLFVQGEGHLCLTGAGPPGDLYVTVT